MLLEAWGDSEVSGDSNSMSMKDKVEFLKNKLAPQYPGHSWVDEGVGDGFPRVLGTSKGPDTGREAQVAPVVVVGGQQQATGGDRCHAFAFGLAETLGSDPSRASACLHEW